MKGDYLKSLLITAFVLLAGIAPARAQGLFVTGTITASGTDCTTTGACVTINLAPNSGAVTFSVSGTFSATLQFEGTVDGTNYFAVNAYPPNSTTAATSTTSTGTWTVAVPAMATFRVRGSAYSNGTATINMRDSTAVSVSSLTAGGGGGGTVTSVGLAGTANQIIVTGTSPITGSGSFTLSTGLPISNTFTNITSTCTGSETWALASAWVANAVITLTGTCTLSLTNPLAGGNYVLKVIQGAGGSHTLALGTGCTWKVSGGGSGAVTPSTGAGAIDVLAFTYDGANCLANYNKNFN